MAALTEKAKYFLELHARGIPRKMAMARAGFRDKSHVSKLIGSDQGKAYLAEIRATVRQETALTAADIASTHLMWANFDPRDVFEPDYVIIDGQEQFCGWKLKDFPDVPEHMWMSITSMKQTKDGWEVKFVDRQKALNDAAEMLGLKQSAGSAIDNGMKQLAGLMERVSQKETEKPLLPTGE